MYCFECFWTFYWVQNCFGYIRKVQRKRFNQCVCWELKCALKGQLLIKDGHLLRTTVKFRGHYVYHQPTSLLIAGGKKGTLVICFFKSWLDFHNWFGASSPNALFFTKVKKMQQKQICRDFEVSCNIFIFIIFTKNIFGIGKYRRLCSFTLIKNNVNCKT